MRDGLQPSSDFSFRETFYILFALPSTDGLHPKSNGLQPKSFQQNMTCARLECEAILCTPTMKAWITTALSISCRSSMSCAQSLQITFIFEPSWRQLPSLMSLTCQSPCMLCEETDGFNREDLPRTRLN